MANIQKFEDLEIYKLARRQCKNVWDLIVSTPLERDYKLRDPINESSGSVMDNIAEGFGRGGNKEFIQFSGFSRGSNNETRAQSQRAFDRKHISEEKYRLLYQESENLNEQISKIINYLKASKKKGSKFD